MNERDQAIKEKAEAVKGWSQLKDSSGEILEKVFTIQAVKELQTNPYHRRKKPQNSFKAMRHNLLAWSVPSLCCTYSIFTQ